MEEMRAMIQSRNGRVPTVPAAVEPVRASSPVTMGDDNLRRIEELADEAENHLEQIATTQDQVMAEADMIQERANEVSKPHPLPAAINFVDAIVQRPQRGWLLPRAKWPELAANAI